MNLRTYVKVGSITNLSDARFCAGFGVDLLGFNLNPASTQYIAIDQANEIMGWVAGPAFVAELDGMDTAAINALQKDNNFPFVQIDQLDQIAALKSGDFKLIFKCTIHTEEGLNQLTSVLAAKDQISHLIVDCSAPQLIPQIEELLNKKDDLSVLKAYDVELSQLDHIIQVQPFSGIELKGSLEEKPGFKEYDELADILEALEMED